MKDFIYKYPVSVSIVAVYLGIVFGSSMSTYAYRKQAIDRGFAHYDNRTGEWTWNTGVNP